jgi:hypothetical protein
MERWTMTWRSQTWVRWLGWMALYGLLYGGACFVALFLGLWEWIPHLVGLAPTFLIGLRFRSWSWVLGPPVVIILGFVALSAFFDILQPFIYREEPLSEAQIKGAEIALGMLAFIVGIPLLLLHALVAATGVEVGKRRSGRQG